MAKDKFLSAAKSGFGFCGVIFGWDSTSAPSTLTCDIGEPSPPYLPS